MKCLSCGKTWQLEGSMQYCPYCGKPLHSEKQKRKCPVCGAGIQEGFLCGSCGFDFSSCMEIYDTFTLPVKTIRSIADSRYEFETKSERLRVPLRRFAGKTETPHIHEWIESSANTTKCRICGISRHRLSPEGFAAFSEKYEDIRIIQFLRMDVKNVPESAKDLSAAGDGSIPAWMEGDILNVVSDGVIAPNQNAEWLFASMQNVFSIHFNDCFDVSDVTNMRGMFYGCSKITNLNLTAFSVSEVTDMAYMFYGCSSLAKVEFSKFDASNVTDMSYMFSGCSSLAHLDAFKIAVYKVRDISYMFYGCRGLRQLDLSGFHTADVTNTDSMFSCCDSLRQLDLSNFDTSGVKNMRGMFYYCESLRQLDLSGFSTSGVKNTDGMFYGCGSLSAEGLRCSDRKIRMNLQRKRLILTE